VNKQTIKANNNPKNRKGFMDYQKRQLELSRITEMESRKRRIESNVDKWTNMIPYELKTATPKNLHETIVNKIKKTSLKPPYDKYVILTAEDIFATKFTSYSILYALIQGGFTTPSQIKITSIMDGYNNINGMFQSRKWKDYFFDNNSNVLLIEGSSKALTLLCSRGEDQFWKELIEFTVNNDKLIIITYATNDTEREKEIFIPELTSIGELNTRIIKKSTFIQLTKDEEKEIKNEQAKFY